MKILYRVIIIFIVINLSACINDQTRQYPSQKPKADLRKYTPSAHLKKPHKNALDVSIYSNGTRPSVPYQVIAKETISKFNQSGIKRQEASIRDNLRSVAVLMGGDAVIDMQSDKKSVTGTIIAMDTHG